MSETPITRKYKIADAYAIEYAKTLRSSFITDQADFETEDSNYANPFEDNWETAIDAAEAIPTDEQQDDELTQLTAAVEAEMVLCRDTFQRAKRYIKKAFPNSKEHWNQFGFDDYEDARQSQARMVPFMKRLHNTCIRYTAQLTDPAVNFTAARIAEIETRRAALNDANNAQEKFKKDMPVLTKVRINTLNAMWDFCTDVAATGKLIYKNDAAQYQRYLLPASDEPADTFVLSGLVSTAGNANPGNSGQNTPLKGVIVQLQPHGLETTTDSNGLYGFGMAPAGPANLRFTHPMFMEQNMPVHIDPENPQTIDVNLFPVAPMP